MAESFSSKFKPLSHEKPKSLFPVANIPLILFTLEFLAANNVNHVIIVSSKETKMWLPIRKIIEESHKPYKKTFKVEEVCLDNPSSLAVALKHLNEMREIKDNFILIQGDIVSNAKLAPALKMHYNGLTKTDASKQATPTIITKVFAEIPYTNPIRDPSQEVALMLDAETR